jgi:hypothetical protein
MRYPVFPEKKERGTVLLMALIVMSSVVISSVGLGSLILSSLQQTRVIDNAIVAYYAAETGAEEALFLARRSGTLPPDVGTPVVLTNNARWRRTVDDTESVIYAGTILEDGFTEIALFNPDTQISTNIAKVEVTWTDTCSGCTVVGANMVGWLPGGAWEPLNPANVGIGVTQYVGGTAQLPIPSPDKLWRLRLIARKGAIENVQIRAYDASNAPLPLPGRVSIDSRGSYGGVEQKLLVRLPRQTPLSGVYDFVVFSECSIVKGGSISCP